MKNEVKKDKSELSRREFIKTSAAFGAASLAVGTNRIYAAGSDKIRIGLVGCGGRGSGAAAQALVAPVGSRPAGSTNRAVARRVL